jgi:HAD superfamily hydrolase (TIGR01509 family)
VSVVKNQQSRLDPYLIRAVMFDLDGVLMETEWINVRSARAAFAHFGCDLDADAPARIVGRHPVDYVPVLAERFGLDEERQRELIRFQNDAYIRIWNEGASLTDGAADTLRVLHDRGLRLVLATSAGRKHVDRCLDRFDLDGLFEFMLTKDDVSRRKPDPEIYLIGQQRLDLEHERILVVEDSEHGVAAAVAAGLPCVAVRTEQTPPAAIAVADACIDSLRELPGLVTAWRPRSRPGTP